MENGPKAGNQKKLAKHRKWPTARNREKKMAQKLKKEGILMFCFSLTTHTHLINGITFTPLLRAWGPKNILEQVGLDTPPTQLRV